jgi:L-ascorbate metabolism protein UlaG (beta-lactamase superfamily)
MNYKYLLIVSVLMLNLLSVKAQYEPKISSVRVTYLANCGFMVQIAEHKILFDASFQNGMNKYLEPDKHTTFLMKEALPPFDDVSMMFVSNYQADHFDPYLTLQFLCNNKNLKLIAPQQAINRMKIFVEQFPEVEKRIIETTPMECGYDRMVIGEAEIFACHIKVPEMMYEHIENMGYLVNINGVKIFHSGDSSPHNLSKLKGLCMNEMKIDIAFLTDLYGIGLGTKITNQFVQPRYIVLMQFDKYITDQTLDHFARRCRLKTRPHIFRTRNEYVDFYISDFEIPAKKIDDLTLSQR